MKKIFVIILNWNRAKDTIQCLKSIGELRIKNYELSIVIVDNASSDDSVQDLEKLRVAGCGLKRTRNTKHETKKRFKLTIIKNQSNLGFAGGNNVGIKHALKKGADYILILNNDTIVDKNLLLGLLKTAEKHPKCGAISPKIYFAKGFEFHKVRYEKKDLGKVIWYAGGKMDWGNVLGSNRGVDEVDKGQYKKTEETDFFTGACALLSSKAVKDVGMFDGQYFMYLEDADLSHRMKKNGWKVLYCPKGHIWHKVAQSSKIGSDLNDYFISRNRLIFGMRYASLKTKLALYKESLNLLVYGREWQRKGIIDFYFLRTGRGSWRDK